jgi:hypothetical protein
MGDVSSAIDVGELHYCLIERVEGDTVWFCSM